MSLHAEIEALRGPFPKKYPENMERAMFEAGAQWATERALRIVREAILDYTEMDHEKGLLRAIERRLKGDDNG